MIELDEDIDTGKTEDTGICKTEDIDICKTEDIDKDKDKTTDKDLLDKINNKIDTINELNNGLAKVKVDVTKKIELIYEWTYEFINNESHLEQMINIIKKILEYFVCEKFINEKFQTLGGNKDMILLHSKYESIKGFKKICRIDISRDIISLNIRNDADIKNDITLYIDGERITLKVSQTENCQGIHKRNISISVSNDKIIYNTSTNINEQNRNYTKNTNEEIECTNKVRYII